MCGKDELHTKKMIINKCIFTIFHKKITEGLSTVTLQLQKTIDRCIDIDIWLQ